MPKDFDIIDPTQEDKQKAEVESDMQKQLFADTFKEIEDATQEMEDLKTQLFDNTEADQLVDGTQKQLAQVAGEISFAGVDDPAEQAKWAKLLGSLKGREKIATADPEEADSFSAMDKSAGKEERYLAQKGK